MMQRIMLILSLNLTFAVNASDCFDSVGRDYHIDPDLIRAIAFRESTMNSHAMNVVSTEKYAIGKMQIHSHNFQHLSQFGITPQKLYKDDCMNIYTGAYFLAIAFKRRGISWDSVGAYNAGFSMKRGQQVKLPEVCGKNSPDLYEHQKAEIDTAIKEGAAILSIYTHEIKQEYFTPARPGEKFAVSFHRDKVKMLIVNMWVSCATKGAPLGQREDGKCFISIGAGGEKNPRRSMRYAFYRQVKFQNAMFPPFDFMTLRNLL